MDLFITIIAAVLILSFLILIHELGHFYMAKRAGIKVEEFGMGLPPRLWGKKKGETIYSINWIPFGGFVRMYGEDVSDPKMIKSKRSFAGKPMRSRVLVVIAGVVMNFFLAWLLLTFGFAIGMRPLLGPDDVMPAIARGDIVIEPGLVVSDVVSGSLAEDLGFEVGDKIMEFNGQELGYLELNELMSDIGGEVLVVDDGGDQRVIEVTGEKLGLTFMEATSFPRLKVTHVPKFDPAYDAGLRAGDVILQVNGQEVFDFESFRAGSKNVDQISYSVLRGSEVVDLQFEVNDDLGVYVNGVIAGTPADDAGLLEGDLILEAEGVRVNSSEALVEQVNSSVDGVDLLFLREGALSYVNIVPSDEGKIGAYLSSIYTLNGGHDVEVVEDDLVSTVTEFKEAKVPFYQAPFVAFKESYRLSVLTLDMVIGVFGQIAAGDGVPDGVAGPVGIVQMAGDVASQGGMPLLQFIAVLSLSLAVMNILPIPALDGGRLLFIIVEAVIGRRINQKLEGYIHAFGYLLLIGLIILVTYNDIARLVTG